MRNASQRRWWWFAGLAGAAGWGTVVVSAVTQLDVAAGFEGGLAMVILASFLDRLTAALAAELWAPAPTAGA